MEDFDDNKNTEFDELYKESDFSVNDFSDISDFSFEINDDDLYIPGDDSFLIDKKEEIVAPEPIKLEPVKEEIKKEETEEETKEQIEEETENNNEEIPEKPNTITNLVHNKIEEIKNKVVDKIEASLILNKNDDDFFDDSRELKQIKKEIDEIVKNDCKVEPIQNNLVYTPDPTLEIEPEKQEYIAPAITISDTLEEAREELPASNIVEEKTEEIIEEPIVIEEKPQESSLADKKEEKKKANEQAKQAKQLAKIEKQEAKKKAKLEKQEAKRLAKLKKQEAKRLAQEKKQQEKDNKELFKPISSGGGGGSNKPPKFVKEIEDKQPRPKASKKVKAWATVVAVITSFAIICGIAALAFFVSLLSGRPELVATDLIAPDSSVIYDSDGNKIMEIGMYLRENVDYEQLPNCLVDAALAIEDSRFFEHAGFDLPRFTKAALINLKSGSFDQGGSTLTMQLIKNTYYQIDDNENSQIASREGISGIKRKAQEIFLSLKLNFDGEVSKKQVLAMYLNKVNYGNNIRGIEKAAEYYFGKRCNELNLPESAFLVGLINSPNSYNPYNNLYKEDNIYLDPETDYLENGTQRRNEVLNLMVQHGYISENEANLAKSVKLEDMLVGVSDSFFEVNEKYQAYIDAVIDEVIETTGESPYEVGMAIHTNMNAHMQEYVYDLQNEAEYTGLEFPNDNCQSAIVLLDNQNGAIEALGGGRGEVESARQFNRATSAYLNPGSSIKPIVDYALAIETLGWATSHTITDQPYFLYDGNILISNYDHTYHGDMLITEALGRSQNTPAVQALAAVVDAKNEKYVVDYLNKCGFEFDYDDFDLQFAIGGNTCVVTPLQLAGAHAMFINGGFYIKPHTINYIEYNGSRENFVADTVGTRVISDSTAWMTAYLEYYNMYGDFSSLMWYCKKDYPLYGKTGTTDWGNAGKDYGIPTGATKDSWLVMQTNKYTISCWTGYDKLAEKAYFTNWEYQDNTKSKIVDRILDELIDHHSGEYDPYKKLEMPDSVTEVTHVKGAYPYAYPDGIHQNVTGYIAKKALEENPLVSVQEAYQYAANHKKTIDASISNITGMYDGNILTVNFQPGMVGQSGLVEGENVDISTTNVEGLTEHAFGTIWFPHWNTIYTGSAMPPFTYTVSVGNNVIVSNTTNDMGFMVPVPGASSLDVCIGVAGSSSYACTTIAATPIPQ